MGTRVPPDTSGSASNIADDAARIDIVGLTKRYLTPKGETFTEIHDVSLTVEPGQFCAIVGPTGCGKSTTLAQVSGLEHPSDGYVSVGGQRVDGITNGVSYMFQSDSLFPWKTVLGNVMMGPILLAHRRSRPSRSPSTGCDASVSPGSRTATRTSCLAACASGSQWQRP